MADGIALPVHGGDPLAMAARYGDDGPWLDFSANINPLGPPAGVLAAVRAAADDVASLMRYPTARDRALRAALARSTGIDAERVVVANGAAALIEAFVRTVGPRRCLVPQPAFSEYGRALAAAGCATIPFALDPEAGFALDVRAFARVLERERPDACIVTNPHNPSGALAQRDDVSTVVEAAGRLGVAVLVDEAFVDYVPGVSIADRPLAPQLLVLRSLTKFYAIPALRVGYGLAPEPFARALTARLPSWPISSIAADAAIAALADHAYAARTRALNAVERERCANVVRATGAVVYPSAANFLLARFSTPSATLTDTLARRHRILVRDCGTYPGLERDGFIRICIRSREDNDALHAALVALSP